jgi:hypothetical protein
VPSGRSCARVAPTTPRCPWRRASVDQGALQGVRGLPNIPPSLEVLLATPMAYLALADDLSPDWPGQLLLPTGGPHVLALVRRRREDRSGRLVTTPDRLRQALIRVGHDPAWQDELRGFGRQLQRQRSEAHRSPPPS